MSAVASTSEVLNKAADLIEQRGWTTGINGWGTAREGSPICLEGGIHAALEGQVPWGTPEFEACSSYRAVKDYLVSTGDLPDDEPLWAFNDHSAAERVIGVLRATALIEASRERESVEV